MLILDHQNRAVAHLDAPLGSPRKGFDPDLVLSNWFNWM